MDENWSLNHNHEQIEQALIKDENFKNYFLPKEKKDTLMSIFFLLVKLLEEEKIDYFITSGTLLGAVRLGCVLPWDDDADIGVMHYDWLKLIRVLPRLNKFGIKTIVEYEKKNKIPFIYKIYTEDTIKNSNADVIKGSSCIDIFCYVQKKKKIVLKHKIWFDFLKGHEYKKKDLFPLTKIHFGGIDLLAPKYPINFLDSAYPGWRERIIIDVRTSETKGQKNVKYEVKYKFNFV